MNEKKLKAIEAHLRKAQSASGEVLATKFSLSLRRVSDYLRELRCLTSYSHKRRFYTLPGKPRFKRERIWQCPRTGALFTDLFSLSALVEWHLRRSPMGLTCRELTAIVGVRVEPQIVRISQERNLLRQKFDGEYVYFSRANQKVYHAQLARRKRSSSKAEPTPEVTINREVEELRRDLEISLALLNFPQKGPIAIVAMLREKGLRVTVDDFAAFLIRYGIKKKDERPEVTQLDLACAAARIQRRLCENGVPLQRCYIILESPVSRCPCCKRELSVIKTTEPRRLRSIRCGEFWIKERVKACEPCGRPELWHPELPRLLAPPKKSFCYDVIAFVGEQAFLSCQTQRDIRKALEEELQVAISRGTVSEYVHEFCFHFECLHYAKLLRIAEWTKQEQLGYMLHVDCSTEKKSDTVFVAYDRTSEIVLISEKIPSERREFLVPVLRKVKDHMGDPVSTMSDLALAFIKALEEVFPAAMRRICHFHFLSDAGKGILDSSYGELRTRLHGSEINANLNALERDILASQPTPDTSWVNESKGPLLRCCSRKEYAELEPVLALHFIRACRAIRSRTGFGYPFDLPWVRYAQKVIDQAAEVEKCIAVLHERRIRPQVLNDLQRLLSPFLPDGRVYEQIVPIIDRCLIRERQFAELRKVMRLGACKAGRAPLSTSYGVNSRKEIVEFNRGLCRYRDGLRAKLSSKGMALRKEAYQIILTHVEKYWGSLILHPTLWRALQCQVVDPTNNALEGKHRDTKHTLFKQSGRRRIHREYSEYGSYLPMISNLKNAKYVECVLGEHKNLPLEFALLDLEEIAECREKHQEAKHGRLFRAVRDVSNAEIV